ncbi:MAG: gliding motility-associated C-terminal domain-containing protein [Bacteroidetes bacterium]|nr:gliding motility-associated C-terminal domain-containing protein [Bacteroidota bacterium]
MGNNVIFFGKWLFCLVLSSFCAIKFAHHLPVPVTKKNISFNDSKYDPSNRGSINTKKSEDIKQINAGVLSKLNDNNFFRPLAGNYTIPVVVHIISQNPDAITDLQIINAINDLNDAFAHTGVYAVGPGANTGITFCLAKIDPDGGITNGITRTKSALSDFDADTEDDRLKNLVSWDTKAYCNIWYVEGIKSELLTTFSCSAWTRQHEAGYAGLSGGGDYRDGIVTSAFGPLLAHEAGHYLGLKHIFEGGCTNTDCNVNGDGVCDTPPQAAFGGSCVAPQNSCRSDTASGLPVDLPDLNSNFMSYSGACTNEFTAGQGVKMRYTIDNIRNSLVAQNKCNPPCAENILAKFTRDNWFPAIGNTINFTSTSTGGTNYQWSVDGVVVGTNSPTYSQSFPAIGKYKVTLKVYNANINCYSTYSDFVIVTCGVMARFFPDKRIIAAKDPFLIDSILFTNRSVGAVSYQWLMSNDQGMAEQVVSTNTDLNYIFRMPANYSIRLVATNGGCSDTTEKFNFLVDDATPDGYLSFRSVDCFQQTKIKITITACNASYAPLPPNIPISFYDGNPASGSTHKIGATFFTRDSILGKCCSNIYYDTIDVGRSGVAQLYAVFNDSGTAIPLALPNTKIIEKNYINNVSVNSGFQFKISVNPVSATLETGDTLQLSAKAGPGNVTSLNWSSAENLNCTNCNNPLFIAGRKDMTKLAIATSEYGCIDSAAVNIKVTPGDDYTIKIDSINCSRNDSMMVNFTICDNFKRPVIPKDLKVAFYDGDPSNLSTHLLGPVFIADAAYTGQCNSYTHTIKNISLGNVFAVVNDNGITIPVQLPVDSVFLEKDYTNNTAQIYYLPDTISIIPMDTVVPANQSVSLLIISPIYDQSSIHWIPGDGYTLSCTNCSSTTATIRGNSIINLEMQNQYGCVIKGQSRIKILPPDMTLKILQTNCFTNDSLLVKFELCMNNDYDSVPANIPVSFFESDPVTGKAKLLEPVFLTTGRAGNCDDFSAVVKNPSTQNLFAIVNNDGSGNAVFDETNFSNNVDNKTIVPFTVEVTPVDTTILRPSPVQLLATVNGGQTTSLNWGPAQFLSCVNCSAPVATPPYSVQFKVEARNEYACIATAYASIKTYTGGRVNIPNGFTPNADGHNDVFYIMGSNEIRSLKDFSIFNRWGQKVFQVINAPANDPDFGWKGFINGKAAEPGAYVYFVNVSFTDGTEQLYKGTVILIR